MDCPKANVTGAQTPSKNPDFFHFVDDKVNWSEIDDSDGDEKKKLLRSRERKSLGVMKRTLNLVLLHLPIPYMLGMVNGRMRLMDSQLIVCLGPSVSTQHIF